MAWRRERDAQIRPSIASNAKITNARATETSAVFPATSARAASTAYVKGLNLAMLRKTSGASVSGSTIPENREDRSTKRLVVEAGAPSSVGASARAEEHAATS